MVGEDAEGEEVARFFDKNGIPGTSEKGANKVESLRGSSSDHEGIGRYRAIVVLLQKAGQCQPKIAITLFIAVV